METNPTTAATPTPAPDATPRARRRRGFRAAEKERIELSLPAHLVRRLRVEAARAGRAPNEEVARRLARSYRLPVVAG